MYHANLLQERKDTEMSILMAMEELIEYPLIRSSIYGASNPSATDARGFKQLLRDFQPNDYDALIVERNINRHCGYVLCPRANLKDDRGGLYRLIGMSGKARDFKILDREETEKWCSEACAKRAMYVRVQLSETAAWDRGNVHGPKLSLLDEPMSDEEGIALGIEGMDLDDEESNKSKAAESLALERGDKKQSARAGHTGLMNVTIQENKTEKRPEPPSLEHTDLSGRLDSLHLNMEGHTTSFGSQRQVRHHEEMEGVEGEDFDTDWDLS